MKYGLAMKRRRLPAMKTQIAALQAAKCEHIIESDPDLCADVLRSGQTLVAYSPYCFAPEDGPEKPRKVAIRVLDALEKIGVRVEIMSEGRTYDLPAQGGALSRLVLDTLSGHRRVKDMPGRPRDPEPTEAQKREASLIWKSLDYATDVEARAAVKMLTGYRWSNAKIRKYLGASSRKPGRKRNQT